MKTKEGTILEANLSCRFEKKKKIETRDRNQSQRSIHRGNRKRGNGLSLKFGADRESPTFYHKLSGESLQCKFSCVGLNSLILL